MALDQIMSNALQRVESPVYQGSIPGSQEYSELYDWEVSLAAQFTHGVDI